MIDWRFHFDDGTGFWVIHRKDNKGGCVTCAGIHIEPGVEVRSVGKFLQAHCELLVSGQTHFEGNHHVNAEIVRLRKVVVKDQTIRMPVVGRTRALAKDHV